MKGDPFRTVLAVARLLAGFPAPWWVAGGWAVDLFLGRRTREHDDVEVAILRRDQAKLRTRLEAWDLRKAIPGTTEMVPWREGEWLSLPIHEVHASRHRGEPSAVEVLLNEAEGGQWRFRRNPGVARPLLLLGRFSDDGLPFLSPEVVLLYKAKAPRKVDEEDFRRLRPYLDREPRDWLRGALAVTHPGHPWLDAL